MHAGPGRPESVTMVFLPVLGASAVSHFLSPRVGNLPATSLLYGEERHTQMQEPQREARIETTRRAGAGEAVPAMAFEDAYVRFAPRLRKVAISRFGIAAEDAEALVHDVFATFLMHASVVEEVERYLIGAICNASRKHLTKRIDAVDSMQCDRQPCFATPDEVILKQLEREQLLARVFARIGSRCRDLLCRYYLKGESTAAIAENLDSTPGSVSVSLHKCRKRAVEAYRSITGAT